MKRYGQIWPQIISFDNLLDAARSAQRGKRYRDNILNFNRDLESNLLNLQSELTDKSYRPGRYRTFEIFDPKPRMISAAPYRDRVVHHALCKQITPLIDRGFIDQNYANRIGYGTHKAFAQFVHMARRYRYVLQCDIQLFFPSIDHEILKAQIRRKLKCCDTLWLIDSIIDTSNPQRQNLQYFEDDDLFTPLLRRKGLPLGNLTSQLFANIYLDQFDHFIKENLKCQSYLRYMDDFCLFSDSSEYLDDCRITLEKLLAKLRLRIHPIKSQRTETRHGLNFLGFRVFPDRIRVRADNIARHRRLMRQLQRDYHQGKIPLSRIIGSLYGWEAHLKNGDTYHLRRDIFDYTVFSPPNQIFI